MATRKVGVVPGDHRRVAVTDQDRHGDGVESDHQRLGEEAVAEGVKVVARAVFPRQERDPAAAALQHPPPLFPPPAGVGPFGCLQSRQLGRFQPQFAQPRELAPSSRKRGAMTKESIGLGAAPAEEDCIPVGHPDYLRLARQWCMAHSKAIKRECGETPANARFEVMPNEHEYGVYFDVSLKFDGDDEHAAHYAIKCDAGAPTTWAAADMEPPDAGRGRGGRLSRSTSPRPFTHQPLPMI